MAAPSSAAASPQALRRDPVLVHRFYDVWDGAVLVGGHDVRDITQDSLGAQVAMVLQDSFLFSGTVIENIRYHKTEATVEQVVEAAKAVGAHDFIMRLANGYDTELGPRGAFLSGGQRQRIALARALDALVAAEFSNRLRTQDTP